MSQLAIEPLLHLVLFKQDGAERFHVHGFNGTGEMVDVTSQYQLIAAEDPTTGQRGFTLLKKKEE